MSKTFEYTINLLKKEHKQEATYLDYVNNNPSAALPDISISTIAQHVNELSLAIEILEENGGQN